MKIKRMICLLLSIVMVLGMLAGCQGDAPVITDPAQNSIPHQSQEPTSQKMPDPDITETVAEEQPETIKAREMGLIPAELYGDLSVEADFAGFHQMMTALDYAV